MRATIRKLTAAAAALVALLAGIMLFAACDQGAPGDSGTVGDSGVEGMYRLSSMTIGETRYALGDPLPDGSGELTDFVTIELKPDNAFEMTVESTDGSPDVQEGTWELEGETLTLDFDGSPEECTLKDGVIIMDLAIAIGGEGFVTFEK